MRKAICTLKSEAPYSPSREYSASVPELPGETNEMYEKRTWRNKCHSMPDGRVFIPPMGFKQSLDSAAKMFSRQIPGKGKSTYTKFFLSGVLVIEPLVLSIKMADVPGDSIFVNADGVRGSGKRVWKIFPRIDTWEGTVTYHLLADEVTKEVFEDTLTQSGVYIGIGRFRPQSGGYHGRFSVQSIKWG